MDFQKILLLYLVFMNCFGFLLMGIDKKKAEKHLWRIPEKSLFLAALFGGSIGSMIGMKVFHHKTRKMIFVVGMPLILILQIALAVVTLYTCV